MKLYLVRHGETLWNKKRIFQGKKDSALTDVGMEQALMLGAYLQNNEIEVDEIYSSPLGRAYNTAKFIFPNRDIVTDERLAEMGFGLWEGKDILDIQAEAEENYYNFFHKAHLYDEKKHKGESFSEVEERVKEFLAMLIDNYKGKTVIVVSHGLLLKVLMKAIKNETLEMFWKTEVFNNTSLSLLEYNNTWEIKYISKLEHLPEELKTSWVPR